MRRADQRFWWGQGAALIVTALLVPHGIHAQASTSTVLEDRQLGIEEVLTPSLGLVPVKIAKVRYGCATGQYPAAVRRARTLGGDVVPDASDYCLAVLIRTGREDGLLQFYRTVMQQLGGAGSEVGLPAAIGAVVVKQGSNQVALGDGKAASVSPALAFDAGFTVAYRIGKGSAPTSVDASTSKAIAERCLDQTESSLKLCYATGYLYGLRAFDGWLPRAR